MSHPGHIPLANLGASHPPKPQFSSGDYTQLALCTFLKFTIEDFRYLKFSSNQAAQYYKYTVVAFERIAERVTGNKRTC